MRSLLAAIRCEKGDLAENLSAHLRLTAASAAGIGLWIAMTGRSLSAQIHPADSAV